MAGYRSIKPGRRGASHLAAKLGAQLTVSVEAVARGVTSAQAVSIASNASANPAAKWVAWEVGKSRGILHQNHGLLTCSRHSFDDAAFWFIIFERACKQQILVESTGIKPQLVSQKTAEYSAEHVGNDYLGWLHFQTLYGHIAATQPDMFD